MVLHARLSAPPPETQSEWPWHEGKWASIPASVLALGDRRMEAESYLSSGYGLRLALEARPAGWKRLGELAHVWQPSRLKGIQVSSEFGTPFLAATQVFDIRPVPRKWLSLNRTEDSAGRFVNPGMILVTCSGSVGRATLAHAPHERTLISHDLLRVEARKPAMWGWTYAFLRSPQARAMMNSARYGHMIKHLETTHLDALPAPMVRQVVADKFQARVQEILDLRNEGHRLALEAEARFEAAIGPLKVKDWGENGFTVRAFAAFGGGRRRFEGVFHNPGVAMIRRHLSKHGKGMVGIRDAGFDVWLPSRFRRIHADDGTWFLDSADIFETNPDMTKRIADSNIGDVHRGRVNVGWLLLARSGQTYGINGSVVLASEALEDKIISDHVIRIAPTNDAVVRVGYLHTVLSHPTLGRPIVKALAYGSSIPEIDPMDFASLEFVRIATAEEDAIAYLAEQSTAKSARADVIERQIAKDAAVLVDRFLAGDMAPFDSPG